MSFMRVCAAALIAITAVLVASSPAEAQPCPGPAAVVFVNGVGNLLADANHSRDELWSTLVENWPDGCQEPLVLLNWNRSAREITVTTGGGAADLASALLQVTKGVSDDDPDLLLHLNIYRGILDFTDRNIVIVAHSQGNLYANKAFDVLLAERGQAVRDRLAIVAVATPDGRVGDNTEPYVTVEVDFIDAVPGALSNNIPYTDCGLWFACHDFVKSYLGREPTREAIIRAVIGAFPPKELDPHSLYSQLTDATGSIRISQPMGEPFGKHGAVIGAFATGEHAPAIEDLELQITVREVSGHLGCRTSDSIHVSLLDEPDFTSFKSASLSLMAPYGAEEHRTHTQTFLGQAGLTHLSPNKTYYVFIFSQCSDGLADVVTDETGQLFYGYIRDLFVTPA